MPLLRIALGCACCLLIASIDVAVALDDVPTPPRITYFDDCKKEAYDNPPYADSKGTIRQLRVVLWYRCETPALDADENGVVPAPVWRLYRKDSTRSTTTADGSTFTESSADQDGPNGFHEQSYCRTERLILGGEAFTESRGHIHGRYLDANGETSLVNDVESSARFDRDGKADGRCRRRWISQRYDRDAPGPGRRSVYNRGTTYEHGKARRTSVTTYEDGKTREFTDADGDAKLDGEALPPGARRRALYDTVVPMEYGYFDWIAVAAEPLSDFPDLLKSFDLRFGVVPDVEPEEEAPMEMEEAMGMEAPMEPAAFG